VGPRSAFEGLAAYGQQINIALLVLAAGFAGVPGGIAIYHKSQAALGPVFVWGLTCALVCLSLAVIGFAYTPDGRLSAAERTRLLLLGAGGLLGLATALLGFVLPFTVYQERLAAGLQSWREHPEALVWPGLALLGGLALMFASLQLGRGMERESQNVRRLIYGFNAVLMTLLLLAVLALPNVLAYAQPFTRFFGRPYDWTASDVNSISPALSNVLADLKEPVRVYVLLPRNSPQAEDSKTLLDNCRSLSANFSWELIDPRLRSTAERLGQLLTKYSVPDQPGWLIVRDPDSKKAKTDYTFVRNEQLTSSAARGPGGNISYAFQGENALLNALVELLEGKMVVYFTQEHGEMSLDGPPPGMPQGRRPQGGGLSVLKQRLTERKSVTVKPLVVDGTLKKVPDDASVVVVARPTSPFLPEEARVLEEYARRPRKTRSVKEKDGAERTEEVVTAGKLVLLFDPIIEKRGGNRTMKPTGLEGLLRARGVKLGDDLILSAAFRDPLQVVTYANPRSTNPIATAFAPDPWKPTTFLFYRARTVSPAGAQPPPGTSVDTLLLVPTREVLAWAETDLDAQPGDLVAKAREDASFRVKKVAREPLSMAVAVSDNSNAGVPQDAAHAGVTKETTPRMVVFGNAAWLSDESLRQRGDGSSRLDLFNSCVSWLREKASIGQRIPPKERKEYDSGIPPQEALRLSLLPPALLLLGVVGLGTGVWVVRRR
jgi:hypothetical protein